MRRRPRCRGSSPSRAHPCKSAASFKHVPRSLGRITLHDACPLPRTVAHRRQTGLADQQVYPSQERNLRMEAKDVAQVVLIGVGATAVMDIWLLLLLGL